MALLVSVQACGFEPGSLPVRDGDGGLDDAVPQDVDSEILTPGSAVRRLEIVDAMVTGGPHMDFPVLVALTEPWLRHVDHAGVVAHAQGHDIHFSADQAGTTPLSHEVEQYRGDAGELVVWVKVPSLSASSVIYLHYGDPTITASTANPPAVWSAGFAGVWHFGPVLVESTGASTNIVAVGTTVVAGNSGSARKFDGTDDYLDFGSALAIDDLFANSGTVEGWIQPTGFGEANYGRVIDKGGFDGWAVFVNNATGGAQFSFLQGTAGAPTDHHRWDTGTQAIALDAWQHFAVTYNRSATAAPTVYLNGTAVPVTEAVGSATSNDSDAAATAIIGNRVGQDRTFAGDLDEMRFSSTPRDAGWIRTSWANQDDPPGFYTVSSPL